MNELEDDNFSRIYKINWLICGPLLMLFAWPYYLIANPYVGVNLSLVGGFFFSMTFTLTVIHGHIAVALGSFHMDTYYQWHKKSKWFPKLTFHPVLFTTRFRLLSLLISLIILFGSILL